MAKVGDGSGEPELGEVAAALAAGRAGEALAAVRDLQAKLLAVRSPAGAAEVAREAWRALVGTRAHAAVGSAARRDIVELVRALVLRDLVQENHAAAVLLEYRDDLRRLGVRLPRGRRA